MIKLTNVFKKIGKKTVINNLNLTIGDSESICIMGPNGSGKSTLIELISGVVNQTSGEIMINENTPDKTNDIGIQFQEGAWPKGATPKGIINFYRNQNFDKEKYQNYLSIFEIEDFLNTDINNLSGGQKQRFNAFLAIINNPKIIILDELITGLDLKMQIKLVKFFKEYVKEQKATLIVVSHMPEEAEMLCERGIILNNGEIVEDFKIKEAVKKFKTLRNKMIKYYEKN